MLVAKRLSSNLHAPGVKLPEEELEEELEEDELEEELEDELEEELEEELEDDELDELLVAPGITSI